ncbi:sodium:solute symporter family protein [Kushneria sp. Sum13]|uniref:sodium:solute symporter family protein n=1 Tax=Kushneria sp. Sum13 TaxID=3459196 RepID=UPI0040455F71
MHTTFFLIGFFAFLLAMIVFGSVMSRRHRGDGDNFLLGGRGVPVFLTIGTTVATMVGTGSSMGAVGFGYNNGWGGALYGIGGAIGILLLAWWFAPMRRLRFMTMSEELAYYVGGSRLVRNVVAVLIYVASIGWLGAHILGGGMYLSWIAGIDLSLAKIIVAIGFGLYCVIGGYMAVVWTDTVQAVLLFLGFIAMAVFALIDIDGFSHLGDNMAPGAAESWFGVAQLGLVPALSLAVVVGVGVLATPSYRQRIYSAQSVNSVRRSFVFTGVLYLAFSIIPAIVGMAAHTLAPDLENSNYAFPYLATQVLPMGLGMLVLIAGLSATMSSASSDALAGVAIMMRDLWVMTTGRTPAPEKVVFFSRIALVVTIGLALAFALITDNVITYITTMIATVMSGLFVCGLLGRFWTRYNWQGAVATLVAASATSLMVTASDAMKAFWGNPSIPAVVVAMIAGVTVTLMTPRSSVTREQALMILDEERARMEMPAAAKP